MLAAGAGTQEPCFFALTRQDLPVIDPATHDVYGGVSKGAYVLEDAPIRRSF